MLVLPALCIKEHDKISKVAPFNFVVGSIMCQAFFLSYADHRLFLWQSSNLYGFIWWVFPELLG